MESEDRYVGIDVAKSQLDIAVTPGEEQWSVSNEEEEGIDTLVSRLEELEPALPRSKGRADGTKNPDGGWAGQRHRPSEIVASRACCILAEAP